MNQSELSSWGFVLDDVPPVELWAQHEQAVHLFCQMGTQWRVGLGGVVGLDYAVLFQLMNLENIDKYQQSEILSHIQILETAALDIFSGGRK